MKKTSKTVTLLGGLGYCSIILQWLWLIMLLLPWLLTLDIIQLQSKPEQQIPPIVASEPSPGTLAAGVGITIVVVALMLLILAKLPRVVVENSSHVIHKTSNVILPAITHQRKIPKKRQLMLSIRIIFGLKILLVFLPFVGLYGALMTHPPLSEYLIDLIGFFLFCSSLFFVVVQRVVAHFQKNDYSIAL